MCFRVSSDSGWHIYDEDTKSSSGYARYSPGEPTWLRPWCAQWHHHKHESPIPFASFPRRHGGWGARYRVRSRSFSTGHKMIRRWPSPASQSVKQTMRAKSDFFLSFYAKKSSGGVKKKKSSGVPRPATLLGSANAIEARDHVASSSLRPRTKEKSRAAGRAEAEQRSVRLLPTSRAG